MSQPTTPFPLDNTIGRTLRPGHLYSVETPGGPLYLVSGVHEKRIAVEERHLSAGRVWTVDEVMNLAGILWPAHPTLEQVVATVAGLELHDPADATED